jgi:hypothetical protein
MVKNEDLVSQWRTEEEEISKYFDKDLRRVVLSAKQKRKKKNETDENQTLQSLLANDRAETK